MEIRKASETDKEKITNLHVASIRKLCGNHYTPEQLNAWTKVLVPSVYDQALREKVFLVACDSQNNLMGIGIFDVENAEISAIYIHPDNAGNGVGSKLLNELEEIARNKNIFKITVHSTLNAKGFYLINGYLEKELIFHNLPNGSKLECVRMLKNLSKDAELAGEAPVQRPAPRHVYVLAVDLARGIGQRQRDPQRDHRHPSEAAHLSRLRPSGRVSCGRCARVMCAVEDGASST